MQLKIKNSLLILDGIKCLNAKISCSWNHVPFQIVGNSQLSSVMATDKKLKFEARGYWKWTRVVRLRLKKWRESVPVWHRTCDLFRHQPYIGYMIDHVSSSSSYVFIKRLQVDHFSEPTSLSVSLINPNSLLHTFLKSKRNKHLIFSIVFYSKQNQEHFNARSFTTFYFTIIKENYNFTGGSTPYLQLNPHCNIFTLGN